MARAVRSTSSVNAHTADEEHNFQLSLPQISGTYYLEV